MTPGAAGSAPREGGRGPTPRVDVVELEAGSLFLRAVAAAARSFCAVVLRRVLARTMRPGVGTGGGEGAPVGSMLGFFPGAILS